MKEVIKRILKESLVIIYSSGEKPIGKDDKTIDKLRFRIWEKMGVSAYAITTKNFMSTLVKIENRTMFSNLKSENELFLMTDDQADKISKVIEQTNNVIKLKIDSIEMLQQLNKSTIIDLLI